MELNRPRQQDVPLWRSPALLLSAADDGYLAFDLRTRQLHQVNAAAALILELCGGGRSPHQVSCDVQTVMPGCDWDACVTWMAGAVEAGWLERDRSGDGGGDANVWLALAELAHILGKRDEARAAYERLDSLQPGNPEVQHLLTALRGGPEPARASDSYVRSLYARFSAFYDENMIDDLAYQAPDLLAGAVGAVLNGSGPVDVLDLGCGTGLAAAALRPRARRLVGVDLSEAMIAKARSRGAYDELHVDEIESFLDRQAAGSFDLVVACDSLIYFGDLGNVVDRAARCLRPGGVVAFTVERSDRPPFRLTDSGRFVHHRHHIEQVARSTGLDVAHLAEGVLRHEYGRDVAGLIAVLRSRGPA